MWMVPKGTVQTNVYTSSYLSHRTAQYGGQSAQFICAVDQFVHSGGVVQTQQVEYHIRCGSDKLYIVSAINASIVSSVFVV